MDIRQALLSLMGRDSDDEPANGRPSRLSRASESFQTRFNGLANSTRQRLPLRVIDALSHSGIPGWEGMSRERYAQDASDYGLEAPSGAPVQDSLRTALRDALAGGEAIDPDAAYSAPLPGAVRGTAPPDAPQGPPQTQLDNQAFLDARTRARTAIAQEGTPYLSDPNVQGAGQALAAAVDQNRASQQEVERRQGVSWDQWWRHRGRQDPRNVPPISPQTYDLLQRYRWGRTPDPNQLAGQRRPGPR